MATTFEEDTYHKKTSCRTELLFDVDIVVNAPLDTFFATSTGRMELLLDVKDLELT